MIVRTFTLFGFLILSGSFWSQQLTQYSQWAFHQFTLNPAHAGIKPCLDMHSIYRSQWVGFEGAPKSGVFTVSAPLRAKRKQFLSARHGAGMRFENDRIGQFGTNRLNFAYAGHFNFSVDSRLSLGLYGGVVQMSFNPIGAITNQPDPQIFREANFIVPDASFGAWWNGKDYYTGLIVQNMIPYRWNGLGTNSYFRRHLMVNGGCRLRINDAISVLPSVLIKIPPQAPWSLDLQTNVNIRNTFDIGMGYRNTDAVIFIAGYKVNQKLSIIYSFDLTTSALKNYSSNTHELSLSFNTCRQEKTTTVSCPLFE
jgi:type IX secretion system PorP/SprF family membrane protein